jgi:hypothetical protein
MTFSKMKVIKGKHGSGLVNATVEKLLRIIASNQGAGVGRIVR